MVDKTASEWVLEFAPPDSPEVEITQENVIMVIAQELRSIKRILWQMAYDPNAETSLYDLSRIASAIEDAKSK